MKQPQLILSALALFSLATRITTFSTKFTNRIGLKNLGVTPRPSYEEYMGMRYRLVKDEYDVSFENGVMLNSREKLANQIIMSLKQIEIKHGLADPQTFTPARHFFDVRHEITNSKLFKIMQKMPKGGVLHAHAASMCSSDFMVNITYRDHLWQCNHSTNGILAFRFSSKIPWTRSNCTWLKTADERKRIGSEKFDTYIRTLFTLDVKNHREIYTDINKIWLKFNSILDLARSLVTFGPVWQEYFFEALTQYSSDNVQYLEFRGSSVHEVHDLDGNLYSPINAVQMYVDTLEKYKRINPDFFGAKFIYCPRRLVSNDEIDSYIKTILELDKAFPDFFAGFDFAGQEDHGRRLFDFVPYVLELPPHINGYFHAGETNWFGETDENLIDAILLGTKRIGHGYALDKHPKLLELIKQQNIAVEVNPVSNQVRIKVLTLVDDYRNHPASLFLAANVPIVISSDNYPLWEATPMSTDYYMTFLGIASSHSDLRTLKKLVENTIRYSSLGQHEKSELYQRWLKKWNHFIEEVIQENF